MSDGLDPRDAKIADLEKQLRAWRRMTWFLVLFVTAILIFILIMQIASINVFKSALQGEVDHLEYIKELHRREVDLLKRPPRD